MRCVRDDDHDVRAGGDGVAPPPPGEPCVGERPARLSAAWTPLLCLQTRILSGIQKLAKAHPFLSRIDWRRLELAPAVTVPRQLDPRPRVAMCSTTASRWFLSLVASAAVALMACGIQEEDPATDTDADTDTDGGETTSDACTADSCDDTEPEPLPLPCETPDPRGCLATGCEVGQVCARAVSTELVPSACVCNTSTGTWECTEDREALRECVPESGRACPRTPPYGLRCDSDVDPSYCSWGQTSCCGRTFASEDCSCGGQTSGWECGSTDACMSGSCEGTGCTGTSRCDDDYIPTYCVDGICTVTAASCIHLRSREQCSWSALCQWRDPACTEEVDSEVVLAGCYPAIDCASGLLCPEGYTCREDVLAVPDCADAEAGPDADPEGSACDACSMTVAMCVPQMTE